MFFVIGKKSMMYSPANLMAMLPAFPLTLNPQLVPLQSKLGNLTNLPPTSATAAFNQFLLPPSAIPSKAQILAEMEVELQKLRFLESLLHTSSAGLLT